MADKEKKKVVREKAIPKKKLEAVEELTNLIKESRSIVMVSVKDLPSSQYQQIKKKLRENAEIKVIKKNIINKAIDNIEKGSIKNLKKYLKEDIALIFSKLDPFELSAILSKNKSAARAKIGQEVPEDIEVEAGPTELIPGPVVSELGGLGIPFAIEDGKINIKQSKIILKAGEKVTEAAASIMSKLDMKPMSVGLEPVLAYDAKEDKIFEDIKVDSEALIEEMKTLSGKALAFAVSIAYACKDTIKFLLAKAKSHEDALSGLIKEEKKPEQIERKEESKPEEKKPEEKKEENAQPKESKVEEEKPKE
jgi:large subunit ribosomal protein L10